MISEARFSLHTYTIHTTCGSKLYHISVNQTIRYSLKHTEQTEVAFALLWNKTNKQKSTFNWKQLCVKCFTATQHCHSLYSVCGWALTGLCCHPLSSALQVSALNIGVKLTSPQPGNLGRLNATWYKQLMSYQSMRDLVSLPKHIKVCWAPYAIHNTVITGPFGSLW